MCVKYLIYCFLVAAVMASHYQNARASFLNDRPAKPRSFQLLPEEYTLSDSLSPSVPYEKPAIDDFTSADFEIPLQDTFNTAFQHSSSQQHPTGYDFGPTETQIHKHIYVHVPPKDLESETDIQPRILHQTRTKQKHYKIVFIKAPEAPSVRTPIVPPLPQNEEKTLIYVLHKKPEMHPDIVIPAPKPTIPSKPEVYFIKYKSERQQEPVYGPPPAFHEILSRRADENNNFSGDDFMSLDIKQNDVQSPTTPTPTQQDDSMQQLQKVAQFTTEAPLALPSDFYNAPSESTSTTEDIQTTTAGPINQYLPPETTLAPIVVKAVDEPAHLPAAKYLTPRRNRFLIKRRK